MPKHFDLLIFDWDGTLMDSAGVIVDSIQRACADIGLTAPSDRASRQIIGLGLTQALQTLLPDLPAAFAFIKAKHGANYPSMISFITGPSRTGDIERILVLGAHGPKKLTIFCL